MNDVFANVPHYDLDKNLLGGTAVDLFNQEGMQIFPSKSEMRKLVKVVAFLSTRRNSLLSTRL